MNQDPSRQLAQKIINKGKWSDMLSRFKDVLRVNLFIVDSQGVVLLPPEESRYGGKILADKSFGYNFLHGKGEFMKEFEKQGPFLEYNNRFSLHSFAIPINLNNQQVIAYLIVGPVILNKRLENDQYAELATKYGANLHVLLDEINSIRVVSNVMMHSILNLLAEIIKDNLELSLKTSESEPQIKMESQMLSKELAEAAREIYSTVRIDELLVTLLDLALKMTNTECGSIMVLDEEEGRLTIKAARGLDKSRVEKTRVKLTEGLSGLAVRENSPVIIAGDEIKGSIPQNRVRHLLNRPEIKHSLILPLVAKERVFGVLNLHTKKEDSRIEDNLDNLQYLAKLLSSVF